MWKPRIHLWLEVAINFLQLICLSPYKFKYNHESDSYTCVSGALYYILPFVVHSFGIIQTLVSLHAKTNLLNLNNPRCIFHSTVAYSQYVIYYTLIFSIWTRRSEFAAFFSYSYPPRPIRYDKDDDKPKDNTKSAIFVWFLCFMMIPIALAMELWNSSDASGFTEFIVASYNSKQGPTTIANLLGLNSGQDRSPPTLPSLPPVLGPTPVALGGPNVLSPQTDLSVQQIVGASNVTFVPVLPPFLPISAAEFGITIAYEIVSLYVRVCNHIAMLFAILAAVTVYQAAVMFVAAVKKERSQDKVIDNYLQFYKFGSLLNKVCGWVIFGTVICCPPFFVVYLMGTLNNSEAAGPRIIFYSVIYCLICGISSEAASKVGELKEWIIENGEGDFESQFFATYVELSNSPMGLKGLGFFTITYGLVAQMLGAIVTFTIILLQFETTPKSPIIDSTCHI